MSKRISSEDSVEQLSRYFNQLTFIKKLEVYMSILTKLKNVLSKLSPRTKFVGSF